MFVTYIQTYRHCIGASWVSRSSRLWDWKCKSSNECHRWILKIIKTKYSPMPQCQNDLFLLNTNEICICIFPLRPIHVYVCPRERTQGDEYWSLAKEKNKFIFLSLYTCVCLLHACRLRIIHHMKCSRFDFIIVLFMFIRHRNKKYFYFQRSNQKMKNIFNALLGEENQVR